MNWNTLLIPKRKYETHKSLLKENVRSPFLNDVDKITFSSYFRTLQDKTQVYPLSQSSYIRTRLTHSLEVSTIGRSLGNIVGKKIIKKYNLEEIYKNITLYDFGYIIQAAALAHDIGNPPFGHNGENAICSFYKSFFYKYININISNFINSKNNQKICLFLKNLQELDKKTQVPNFTNFDGNAQGFKIITSLAKEYDKINNSDSKNYAGLNLTYPVLATFCKYPNLLKNNSFISSKKLGVFTSEREIFEEIKTTLNLGCNDKNITYRYPLTFLLEAADDICYLISDLCDAFSVGILDYMEVLNLFSNIITSDEAQSILNSIKYYRYLQNQLNDYKSFNTLNKKILTQNIEFLASEVINILTLLVADTFLKNEENILKGEFNKSLLDSIPNIKECMNKIRLVSETKIYSATEKITQEIKGNVAITHLLEEFTNIVISLYRDKVSLKSILLNKLYFQGNIKAENGLYDNLQLINNFIVSCTDKKILDVFYNLKGL